MRKGNEVPKPTAARMMSLEPDRDLEAPHLTTRNKEPSQIRTKAKWRIWDFQPYPSTVRQGQALLLK